MVAGRMLWLAYVARDAGLEVVEVPGWKTRGTASMNPRGIVCHHTATPASRPGEYPTYNVILNGNGTVPGPLSQYGLGRSGVIYVFASGKANHAGLGQWEVAGLDHSTDVIGIEAEHPGLTSTPWPATQLTAYHILCAAILNYLNRPTIACCAHREWAQPPESTPNRKTDPIGLNMDQFRSQVDIQRTRLRLPPGDLPMELTPAEETRLRRILQQGAEVPDYATTSVAKAEAGGFAYPGTATQMVPRYDILVWLDRLGALDDFRVDESDEVHRVEDRVGKVEAKVDTHLRAHPGGTSSLPATEPVVIEGILRR